MAAATATAITSGARARPKARLIRPPPLASPNYRFGPLKDIRGGGGTVRRWVILALLVAVPVVFHPRSNPPYRFPKFVVLMAGAVVVSCVWFIEVVANPRRRRGRLSGLEAVVLALLLWTSLAAAVARSPRTSVLGAAASRHGLVSAAACVVIFLATTRSFRGVDIRRALAVLWFGAGGAVVVFGASQVVAADTAGPVRSTLGSPAELAGFFAMLVPVAVVVFVLEREPAVRALIALGTALLLVEMAAASGRSGTVAMLAALGLLCACCRRRVVLAAAFAVVAVLAAAYVVLAVAGVARYSPRALVDADQPTVAVRAELWRGAVRIVLDHPLTGVGPDHFAAAFDEVKPADFTVRYPRAGLATDPHNVFLDHAAALGFPGLIAYIGVLVAAAWRVVRAWRAPAAFEGDDRLVLAGLAASLLASVVHASFSRQHIALDFCFWTLLGLTAAATRSSTRGAWHRVGTLDRAGAAMKERPDGV